jgi:hypothetical protein
MPRERPCIAVSLREDLRMEIICVTVDSAEPERVAEFWNAALRWGGVSASPDGSGAICGPTAGGNYLEFVRVPEAKAGKNRLHLGCAAGSLAALDAEITRLEALGAQVAWEEGFPEAIAGVYRNVILRDVEGNEFCLSGGEFPAGGSDER